MLESHSSHKVCGKVTVSHHAMVQVAFISHQFAKPVTFLRVRGEGGINWWRVAPARLTRQVLTLSRKQRFAACSASGLLVHDSLKMGTSLLFPQAFFQSRVVSCLVALLAGCGECAKQAVHGHTPYSPTSKQADEIESFQLFRRFLSGS